ncbi:MAG: phosphatase PAP2 family protein [Bacteroidales bacterium]
MIDWLNQLDTRVFLFLNGLHSPGADQLMWWFTKGWIWAPLYLVFLIVLWKKLRTKIWVAIVAIILLVAITDQTSVRFFKNPVQRLRPSHNPQLTGQVHTVNGYKGGKFGFISSHAANTFGIALLLALLVRRKWFSLTLLGWAALMSYSRIYLGVHYPGDIFCGMLWGMLLALGVYYLARLLLRDPKPQPV